MFCWRQWISPARARAISNALKQLAPFDAHADRDGVYRVRTAILLPEREERASFALKRYNDSTAFIRLEMRWEKCGNLRKETTALTLSDAERLLAGDIAWIDGSATPLLKAFRACAACEKAFGLTWDATASVQSFAREAYEYRIGGVRVTLDSAFARADDPLAFLSPALPPDGGCQGTLLTVRYDAFLPQVIGNIVNVPDATATRSPQSAAAWAF